MVMGAPVSLAVSLSLSLSLVTCDTNITLLSLPVNLTSWRLALQSALNYSLYSELLGISRTLQGYVGFVRNGSIGCSLEGEECIPGTPSCCPAIKETDTELTCQGNGNSYFCRIFNDSEELTQRRLDDLDYGDSINGIDSHPWAEDWAFQSKSAIEREEEQAAEEALWKKNWIPNPEENLWLRTYSKLKRNGKKMWHDLRKLKKLRELKEKLIDKYKDRVAKLESKGNNNDKQDNSQNIIYPDEETGTQENGAQDDDLQKLDSEESVIKFSDEIKKPPNKLEFRIDDIIKDAISHIGQKTVNPLKKNEETADLQPFSNPLTEKPITVQDIEGTEDKLMREIEDLKVLRKLKEHHPLNEEINKFNEPNNIDELIKRQVNAILEEERKLDRLRKIEELRRLEQGMNKNS